MSSGPQASGSTLPYSVGKRYIHAKNKSPLTLRYIGTLPPGSADSQLWLGIEYDDASHGKHSGTFKDAPVFQTRQPGAGAFVKYTPGTRPLLTGETVISAVEGRYGSLTERPDSAEGDSKEEEGEEAVVLGSSNAAIVVEAPNMDSVRRRIKNLDRLREVGLDGQAICALGGDDERRSVLKARLKNVTTLDLSRNLIADWDDVAEIASHFVGLKTLVLNHSRIARTDEALVHAESIRRAFGGVTELHLGGSGVDWREAVRLGALFPNLAALFLNDNPITELRDDGAGTTFAHLTSLSLDACPIASWDAVAELVQLPRLESLNVSGTRITAVPAPGTPFPRLTRLTLADTRVSHWTSIDHLARWARVEVLRLTCACAAAPAVAPGAAARRDPARLSGDARADRAFLVAKLAHLSVLNGVAVTRAERRDAELYYVHSVAKLPPGGDWGRYAELAAAHGAAPAPGPGAAARGAHTLKAKLLDVTVVPPAGAALRLRALPGMRVAALQKKVAARLRAQAPAPAAAGSGGPALWTAFARAHAPDADADAPDAADAADAYERGERMDPARELGWYLSAGDAVVLVGEGERGA